MDQEPAQRTRARQSTPVQNHEASSSFNRFIEPERRLEMERTVAVESVTQLNSHCKGIIKSKVAVEPAVAQANLEFLTELFEKLGALNEKVWSTIYDAQELRADKANQYTLALEVRITLCRLRKLAIDNGSAEQQPKPFDNPGMEDSSKSQQKNSETSWNSRKLEPLKMDRFDGKVESWLPWWSRFEDRIHNETHLNDRTKYDYLLQYLSKEVREKLRNIPIDEAFYNQAVSRLKTEFGNPEKLRTLYTQRLMTVKPITSRYDISGLRDLLQTVLTSITALERIGIPKESVAPFFMPKLKETLPVDIYLEFKTATRKEKLDEQDISSNTVSSWYSATQLDSLLEFINSCLADLEDIGEESLKQLHTGNTKKSAPTAVALKTEVQAQQSRKKKQERKPMAADEQNQTPQPCLFCKSTEHRTQACESNSTTLDQRKELLIRENRCCKCTKKGHRAAQCRSVVSCGRCSKKGHMTPLCNNRQQSLQTAAAIRKVSPRTHVPQDSEWLRSISSQ